jgi:hypothetical protein
MADKRGWWGRGNGELSTNIILAQDTTCEQHCPIALTDLELIADRRANIGNTSRGSIPSVDGHIIIYDVCKWLKERAKIISRLSTGEIRPENYRAWNAWQETRHTVVSSVRTTDETIGKGKTGALHGLRTELRTRYQGTFNTVIVLY